jgi:hypothetical protein
MNATLTCAFAHWSPGLGDNHPIGWLTVAVYLAAALISARAAMAKTASGSAKGRERVFWSISAAVMLFLAVNKQLDLQSLVTTIGRCHAQLADWYDIRRSVQRVFILAVGAGGAVALGLFTILLWGILGKVWPALLGLGFVCVFVVMRAASFHNFDVLIGQTALGLRVNWLLELPGPALVILVALRRRRALSSLSSAAATNQG